MIAHLLDVEEVVGGDAAPGVRVLALQPVLEDALLAPDLLAVAPAALAEQPAHGALVTWSHTGHTLSVVTPCQWSHTGVVTLSVGHCCAMVVPGDTRQHCPRAASPCWCCHHRLPTPTPGPQPAARSGGQCQWICGHYFYCLLTS